ncbi:MAG: class I SAM-dependent methyltransferase [Phycisphaerales bacterium]
MIGRTYDSKADSFGKWFQSAVKYRLRYYARSFIYGNPAIWRSAEALLRSEPPHRSSDFWNQELTGDKSCYLGGTLEVDVRNALTVAVIRRLNPGAKSLLDVGCAGGTLATAAFEKGMNAYMGVDISDYAISQAAQAWLGDARATFRACDLYSFDPGSDVRFDAIVFNEVLYYLHVGTAWAQVVRYARYLNPDGVVCVSMKHDPKSHAIFRGLSRQLELLESTLLQSVDGGLRRKIVVDQRVTTRCLGVFRPKNGAMSDSARG